MKTEQKTNKISKVYIKNEKSSQKQVQNVQKIEGSEKQMYAIYDVKNDEQCVAIFNYRKEVAEYFNTTVNCIGTAITRKHKRKGRFLIQKIEERGESNK